MNTEEIKALRMMAKYPTVTVPRDPEILKAAADFIEAALSAKQGEQEHWTRPINYTPPHMAYPSAEAKRISELEAQNAQLLEALKGLEPYLDRLVCYASTATEHKPNEAVMKANAAIAAVEGKV